MAVSTKRRRKITCGERRFLWFVKDGEGRHRPWADWLVVYSEDKKLYVTYELKQKQSFEVGYLPTSGEHRMITYPPKERVEMRVEGLDFIWPRENVLTRGLIECPVWERNGIVTSGDVRRLVEWCLSEK